ncbi:hypothetical protein ACTQ42_06545 [Streptococcus alactolyticus]|uniref:hypothetical protein n=1 Tax=Streptococcus alactolyticus TaxID=29389 RepID=UPI003F9C78A7
MIDKQINKIYVYCPANNKSGGPELLHQLCYLLNERGINCFMVYYGTKAGVDNVHPEFKKYHTIEASDESIKDEKSNLIIVPEASIFHLNKFTNAKKAIWWLSVDNFTKWATPMGRLKDRGILRMYSRPITMFKAWRTVQTSDYHFCQSFYSKEYVTKVQKIPENRVFMLSDYLSENYLMCDCKKIQNRQNSVAFFPRKGYEITKKLMELAPDLDWKPVENMTSEQVQDLLSSCKVYMDFGHFPGKDRVPREAAMCGCCVITGRFGASKYAEDVPINDKYKFEKPLQSADEIIALIKNCFENYDINVKDFDSYRDIIKKEKQVFIKQVEDLFVGIGD